MDTNPFTADALAAAAADGDRVCLSNLLVRHRKRRGAKMFFATASAEAGWDVQLSFMTRRGKAHDDAETSVRLTPEAHAAAYEGCAPGATIDKVWGALERGRVVSAAEKDAREADDTSDFDDTDDGANGLRVKTRGRPSANDPRSFTAPFKKTAVTLRVDRVEFASPRNSISAGDPTDVRDAAAVDGPDCWLVFDMAYDATMTDAEHGGLSRQITMCVAANKSAKVPFRLAVVADGALAEPNANENANENERWSVSASATKSASSRRVDEKKKNDVFFHKNDDDALSVARAPLLGAGAGATGEGSRRVPDSSNAFSDCAVTRSALKPRPHRLWRALPWRAWGAPRVSPETFFSAAVFGDALGTTAAPFASDEKHDDERRTHEERMTNDTKNEKARRRVIYLSADAENTLETIEPGDVFVLGGVVDHAPKPALARRRFDTLRETFFSRSARDAVAFSTLRLPLAGHVSLAKNAHLPCLAVAQTLMVFRRVHRSTEKERGKETESRRGPTASGDVARRRDAEPGRAPWPEKEGGANASVWGETLARCPAFRCAPLRKYVRWAPPYEALNEKEGEVKPSCVTDVDALF